MDLAADADWPRLLAQITDDPSCAGARDEEGALPLHNAVSQQAPPEVVAALLNAYPDGARTKVRTSRCLALHEAAEHRLKPDAFRLLLAAYLEGAREEDRAGRVPLALAASGADACVEVVDALLEAHENGAKVSDEDGMLPLHRACATRAPVAVVRALLRARPGSAGEPNRKAGWLPLHYAARESAPVEACITASLAVAVRRGGASVRSLGGRWCGCCAKSSREAPRSRRPTARCRCTWLRSTRRPPLAMRA